MENLKYIFIDKKGLTDSQLSQSHYVVNDKEIKRCKTEIIIKDVFLSLNKDELLRNLNNKYIINNSQNSINLNFSTEELQELETKLLNANVIDKIIS